MSSSLSSSLLLLLFFPSPSPPLPLCTRRISLDSSPRSSSFWNSVDEETAALTSSTRLLLMLMLLLFPFRFEFSTSIFIVEVDNDEGATDAEMARCEAATTCGWLVVVDDATFEGVPLLLPMLLSVGFLAIALVDDAALLAPARVDEGKVEGHPPLGTIALCADAGFFEIEIDRTSGDEKADGNNFDVAPPAPAGDGTGVFDERTGAFDVLALNVIPTECCSCCCCC